LFGLVVRFDLKDGVGAEFDALVAETVRLIQKREPGTVIYTCHAVQDARARIFYELYLDRDAFEEHERQEHVRRFLDEREQYLANPVRVEFLDFQVGKGVPEPAARRDH
jgi:quinol monooxygenase YgiN